MAADQGHEKAAARIGYLYGSGLGVLKDEDKAHDYFLIAAKQGDVYASEQLGKIYYYKTSHPNHYQEAAKWYLIAAEAGGFNAQRNLASLYQFKLYDYDKAFYWNKKLVEQNHPIAFNNLGDLYENGYGVQQDTKRAVELYLKAIELGEGFGKISMGMLYQRDDIVDFPQDLTKAKEWYLKALDSELKPHQRERAEKYLAEVETALLAKRYIRKPSKHDVAVIIGNRNYAEFGRDIPDVTPAINDAKQIKKYFTEILGVDPENIIYVEDAKTADLNDIFGNNRSHKGEAYSWVREGKSNLYVYYSGHGAPADNGDAYLVPINASADNIELNGYPLSQLYDNLSKIKTKSTTVILESCFSGNSDGGTVIANASPVYMKARDESVPVNLNVITAGSANELASWTKDKNNGLFTHYYIKAMSGAADGPDYGNGDGKVSEIELKAYLDDTVTYFAKRHYKRKQVVQMNFVQ